MGRKKKEVLVLKPFCYYCDKECEDEATLHTHQKVRHFSCPNCRRAFSTSSSMAAHMLQVHKQTLTKVPNAKSGRDGLEITVYGTKGIPQAVIDQKMDHLLKQKGSSKLTRKDIKKNFGFQQNQQNLFGMGQMNLQPELPKNVMGTTMPVIPMMQPQPQPQPQPGPYMPNPMGPAPIFGGMPPGMGPPPPMMLGSMPPPQFNPEFTGIAPPNLLNSGGGGGYMGPNITPLPQMAKSPPQPTLPTQMLNPMMPQIAGASPNMIIGTDNLLNNPETIQLPGMVIPSSSNNQIPQIQSDIIGKEVDVQVAVDSTKLNKSDVDEKILGQFRKARDEAKEALNEDQQYLKSGVTHQLQCNDTKKIISSNSLKKDEQDFEKSIPISFSFGSAVKDSQFSADKAFKSSVEEASKLFSDEDKKTSDLKQKSSVPPKGIQSNLPTPPTIDKKDEDDNEMKQKDKIDIFESLEVSEHEPISFDIN